MTRDKANMVTVIIWRLIGGAILLIGFCLFIVNAPLWAIGILLCGFGALMLAAANKEVDQKNRPPAEDEENSTGGL